MVLLELIFLGACVLFLGGVAYKSGILTSQKNKLDKAARDLNNKVRNPVADAEAAMISAAESLEKLKGLRIEERTRLSKFNRLLRTNNENVQKWEELAVTAGGGGDKNDVVKCLTNKAQYERNVKELEDKIAQSNGRVESLSSKIAALETKIANAADQKQILQLRMEQAQVDEDVQRQLSDLDIEALDGSFARLEEDTLNAESRTEALLQEGADSTPANTKLEQKYTAPAPSISDDLLKKYLKQA